MVFMLQIDYFLKEKRIFNIKRYKKATICFFYWDFCVILHAI